MVDTDESPIVSFQHINTVFDIPVVLDFISSRPGTTSLNSCRQGLVREQIFLI